MSMTAHEDWIQHAIVGVETVRATFTRPDDDWHHMLLGQDRDGGLVMMDIREAFVDAPTKEAFAAVGLPRLIVAARLHRVALVSSAWITRLDGDERVQVGRAGYVRPSLHPRRQEVVMIYACSDGAESMSTARIKRDGERPPRLSEWTQATTQDGPGIGVDGLFAAAIRRAVAEVRGTRGGPR
jgi:hypothetical protein